MNKNYTDDVGSLDKRVTFQRFVGEGDLVGDYHYLDDKEWKDVTTIWAEIRTISSREFMAAGVETTEVTHNIKIRRRSWDYNVVTMRAQWKGKIFRLLSPPLDLTGRKRHQLIKAAEVWRE